MKTKISNYIKHTISTPNKLNVYVPNSHIGTIFSEVYEFIEYFESGEHTQLFSEYNFESCVNEVFIDNDNLTDEIVYSAYQTLRSKRNNLRNLMILLMIEGRNELMIKRVNKGMFNIYKNFAKEK